VGISRRPAGSQLSTIRNADTIVVMDAGRIVEQGSHDDLLRRHGF
jgi:ABC-type multidrug transport system fused ATPase/permease subunit